ncbi:hypothetical protein J7L29_01695 [Candidatus Bathyarchaeota archaeon]|nr:hypothetical protein [Candidatus Bathyarchaeota archaeon]
MFLFKLIRLKFFSPIIFQRSYIETPWRVPSDYLVRALTYAYSKLYNVREWFRFLEHDILRISSLILIRRDNLCFPDYGVKGYSSLNGDVVDSDSLVDVVRRVRIPRIEGVEPTPFEDYQLLTPNYEWGIILGIHKKHYEEIIRNVMASLRLLGEFGLGARKSRGGGRFKIVEVNNVEDYGVMIAASGMGKLISRYINRERDIRKIRVAHRLHIERTRIYYGDNKFKEFHVIAEGSEVEINDNGRLEYFKNDLSHNVPLYYRPLMIGI